MNSKLFVIVFLPERQREFYALLFEVQFKGNVGWGVCECWEFVISFKESNQESTPCSTVHPSVHPSIHPSWHLLTPTRYLALCLQYWAYHGTA